MTDEAVDGIDEGIDDPEEAKGGEAEGFGDGEEEVMVMTGDGSGALRRRDVYAAGGLRRSGDGSVLRLQRGDRRPCAVK